MNPQRLLLTKENVRSMDQAQKLLQSLAEKMEAAVEELRGEATLAG